MSVLILHRDLRWLGGVESYYTKLSNKFTMPVHHFVMGRRPEESGHLSQGLRMIVDYWRFFHALERSKIQVVHVNPSLEYRGFMREGMFLLLSRMRGRKTIVFFRGWQKGFEQKIDGRYGWLFRMLYGKTDVFLVLSEEFKRKLQSWGCTQPIHLEVTVADDDAMKGFDMTRELRVRLQNPKWRILFSSRLMRIKGVYEVIQAFSLLRSRGVKCELVIAGSGEELENAKQYVEKSAIPDVLFTGHITGEAYWELFRTSHVLCFPTQHGEGMPNIIIEAMAFGLPVITRLVGGIGDMFVNGKHGFATKGTSPEEFCDLLEKLHNDHDLYRSMAMHNYTFIQSRFLASQAVLRLEQLYGSLMQQ